MNFKIQIEPIGEVKIKDESYIIQLKPEYIDIEDKTPVLDIKPYFSTERVKNCKVPNWCKHWPQWYEDMTSFEWRVEINL